MNQNHAKDYLRALAEIDRRSASHTGYIADPHLTEAVLQRNLLRTNALLEVAGAPQNDLRIIHVAGSKGKGSTAAYIANILVDSGLKTGLFTSPHLHTFRERMSVSGDRISPNHFANIAGEVTAAAAFLERNQSSLGTVNAFEFLFVMALQHFCQQRCDVAVLEVGLGGRYDPTNVVSPVVSVITRLELEHTGILGQTIEEIAWNKGGIIKSGTPVVVSQQDAAATTVLNTLAHEQRALLLLGGRDWRWRGRKRRFTFEDQQGSVKELEILMPGSHQLENAATAVATVRQLSGDGLPPRETEIRSGLQKTTLPGRFEITRFDGRQIILDVAHTPAAVTSLGEALAETGPDHPVIIAGFLNDKDLPALVRVLGRAARHLYLTPVDNPRSATIGDLRAVLINAAGTPAEVTSSMLNAFEAAWNTADTTGSLVITGSTSLVAEARVMLGLAALES